MAISGFHKQMTSPDVDNGVEKSFTETSLIELDNPLTPQIEIENDKRYPYQFQPHPKRNEFFAIQRDLDQRIEHPNIRTLKVTWATRIPTAHLVAGKAVYSTNPLQRPATIEWGTYKTVKTHQFVYERFFTNADVADFNKISRKEDVDKKGKLKFPEVPPKNAAGEAIFIQDQTDFRVISFSKNVQQLPPFMAKAGCFINTDKVRIRGSIFSPGSLLATDLKVSDWQFEGGIPYLTFSWNFYVDEVDFWMIRKRNVGFNEKVKRYKDKDDNEVPLPVPNGKSYYVLVPIEIGPVDNRHYPSQPVLLRTNGRALRTFRKGDDIKKPETWTGEIMTTESKDADLRDQAQKDKDWTDSEIQMRTKPYLEFNKYFPMT